jgi:putative ABC transport system ATP-binding protein
MIELENVSKVYRSAQGEVRALDGVSLLVPEGDFLAVRGHSGCGKSTLLSLIGGLALPTSGRVVVGKREISHMTAGDRAQFRAENVGFVFQMFHLLPYLTVVDNVLLASPPERRREAREEACSLLDQFGLDGRRLHRPAELSAGERQRVAMARALLNRPRLLLADEPTGNLDPRSSTTLLGLLAEFHDAGGTVVLVTHEEAAARYAQRTVVLNEGRLEAEGAT